MGAKFFAACERFQFIYPNIRTLAYDKIFTSIFFENRRHRR